VDLNSRPKARFRLEAQFSGYLVQEGTKIKATAWASNMHHAFDVLIPEQKVSHLAYGVEAVPKLESYMGKEVSAKYRGRFAMVLPIYEEGKHKSPEVVDITGPVSHCPTERIAVRESHCVMLLVVRDVMFQDLVSQFAR
jgi:hypothetical protein